MKVAVAKEPCQYQAAQYSKNSLCAGSAESLKLALYTRTVKARYNELIGTTHCIIHRRRK